MADKTTRMASILPSRHDRGRPRASPAAQRGRTCRHWAAATTSRSSGAIATASDRQARSTGPEAQSARGKALVRAVKTIASVSGRVQAASTLCRRAAVCCRWPSCSVEASRRRVSSNGNQRRSARDTSPSPDGGNGAHGLSNHRTQIWVPRRGHAETQRLAAALLTATQPQI